ncbi:uncharacterized protein N0V89_000867 [Didymosphaeria variabile]|uniref:MARVEL domain-containing protein n=1 Tax=Didymosphaeria variabile TaxID=1932322 RepID=A0A9W9CG94_9PLEO|nr:uncharacterized protein N0V89_000867 [Didymosphaeria variabile]KAJ4360306.1 hypothetical protein N0V89_000867 [Didymosphaeria variabile]
MVRWYPRDTRWRGVQKHYFNVSTFKSLVLVAYVILIIVEGALLRRWFRESNRRLSTNDMPWAFWARTGVYLVIDAALSLVMAYFTWKEEWHPVAALVTAILVFGLWFAACFFNAIVAYSNEYWFKQSDQWQRIAYGEAGLQATIAACYLAMMGFAAKAVHEWRKVKIGKLSGYEADPRVDELDLEEREGIKCAEEPELVHRNGSERRLTV